MTDVKDGGIDPTVEYTEIELNGTTYKMCFDLASLAKAEAEVHRNGGDLNVLRGIDFESIDMRTDLALFACSLRRAQPDLKYEDILTMAGSFDMQRLSRIHVANIQCWMRSMGVDVEELKKSVTLPNPTTDAAPSSDGAISAPSLDSASA